MLPNPRGPRLIPRELVENSNQFSFRGEVDFNSSLLALTDDSNSGAQKQLQAVLGRTRVHVDRYFRRLFGCLAVGRFDRLAHERFRLANRQAPRDDVAREAALV